MDVERGSWNQLTGVNPEYLVAANADGDIASELAIDFGPLGLWLWNAGTWAQLTEDDPEYMVAGDTDRDSRHEIVVDFGTLGCWIWNEGAWGFLSGDNPEFMTMVPAWGANHQDAVAVDFGSLGLFRSLRLLVPAVSG